jgi:hypothetical protein
LPSVTTVCHVSKFIQLAAGIPVTAGAYEKIIFNKG